jgi:large subunit ribosomal protein L1
VRAPISAGVFQPILQARFASEKKSPKDSRNAKKKAEVAKKKRKTRTSFKEYDLKDAEQFSLLDAMRYACQPICLRRNFLTLF